MDIGRAGRGEDRRMTVKWTYSALLGVTLLALGSLTLAGCSDDDQAVDSGIPKGNGVCLQKSQIDHTEIINDGSVVFFMKTGKPYLNTLRFPCPSLTMEGGFAYQTDFPEICSQSQTIRVLRSGNFCELGNFTPFDVPPPAAKP
jgi:hypothetical protein